MTQIVDRLAPVSNQTKVKSPCMGVCSLDERDICIACRRSGMEIAQWGVFSEEQKRAALLQIELRYQDEQ